MTNHSFQETFRDCPECHLKNGLKVLEHKSLRIEECEGCEYKHYTHIYDIKEITDYLTKPMKNYHKK